MQNNKHLYFLSGILFFVYILCNIIIRFTDGGIWLAFVFAPVMIFSIVLSPIFFIMAFIRNYRDKRELERRPSLNPIIPSVLGVLIIVIANIYLGANDNIIKIPLDFIGGGMFVFGFLSFLKKIFSNK